MIDIKPIASGSSGNCYLLDDGHSQLILEAGIPFNYVEQAMDFDLSRLAGILITHEHVDHMKFVEKYVTRTTAPVFATQGTLDAKNLSGYRYRPVKSKSVYRAGTWQIMPFDVEHDAAEPVGYLVTNDEGERLIYVTDTYYVAYRFKHVNYMLVEMNYALDIATDNVNNGILNYTLKNRILTSHFEMQNSLDFIKANMSPELKEVWIIHISKTNGDPNRFKDAVQKLTGVPVYLTTSLQR